MTPHEQSDSGRRPFPTLRAVLTIAAGIILVTLLYWSGYKDNPSARHAPRGMLIRYAISVMSVVGLLNGAILLGTWRVIRGAAARGLLLAATGALTGAVGGSYIGSMEWGGDPIARLIDAFGGAIINMVVWAFGGVVSSSPRTAKAPDMDSGSMASWRWRRSLRQPLVGFVTLTAVAGAFIAFDGAYLHAYTTKPLQGLERWTQHDARFDALVEIAMQNISALVAILTGSWIARRISDGRTSGLLPLAIVLFLLSALVAISGALTMLGKIGQP